MSEPLTPKGNHPIPRNRDGSSALVRETAGAGPLVIGKADPGHAS